MPARAEGRRDRDSIGRTLHHGGLCALLAGGLAISGFALGWAARRPDSLRAFPTAEYALLLSGLAAATGLALLALAVRVRAWRERRSASTSALPFRMAGWVLVSGWTLYLCCFQPFKGLYLVLYSGVLAGVFALGVLVAERAAARPPRCALRILDAGISGACLTVVILELLLRLAANLSSEPIFVRSSDPRDVMERNRMLPGRRLFGFPCNSRGYYDEEPIRRAGERMIVAIGDSFSVGIVPHALHYTSVCERALPGRQIYNVGINSTGPAEYLRMLEEDALPLVPDAILIAIFVGNDIVDAERYATPHPFLQAWFDRRNVLLFLVSERLAALLAEERRHPDGPPVGTIPGQDADLAAEPSLEELPHLYPWLADPSLETPTFSEQAFLQIESGRALQICRPDAVARFDPLFAAIHEMRERAHGTPLLVLLIPDEFQVEDELWAQVLAANARVGELDRDQPQRVLAAWLATQGIPFLDLLPPSAPSPPDPTAAATSTDSAIRT